MIRIGGSSFFLYMSIITLKKSALKDVPALRTSGLVATNCVLLLCPQAAKIRTLRCGSSSHKVK